MFKQREPRRFHHEYIYVDERKERLKEMEERAKRDLGMLPPKEFTPEDIRGKFVDSTTHLKRRKESESGGVSSRWLVFALVILGVLFYAFWLR